MFGPVKVQGRPRGARPGTVAKVLAVLVLLALGAVSAVALAKGAKTTLRTTHNSTLAETIIVDSHGRTLYELRPETSHHLLCTSNACFQFWPPLKVGSAHAKLTKATGIKGKLGILHRAGFFQATLNGLPLYRYSGDSAAGQANGQGIKTFGGTWHVVTASSPKTSTSSTTTGSTTMPGPYSTTTPGPY